MAAVVYQLEQLEVWRGHPGEIFEQTQKQPKRRRNSIPIWTANRK
jgi:hypothetical protein